MPMRKQTVLSELLVRIGKQVTGWRNAASKARITAVVSEQVLFKSALGLPLYYEVVESHPDKGPCLD